MWHVFLEKVGNSVRLSYLMYTTFSVKILWNIYKLTSLFAWPFTVKLHWVQLLWFIHMPKLSTTILHSKTFDNNFDLDHTVESVCDDSLSLSWSLWREWSHCLFKIAVICLPLGPWNCIVVPLNSWEPTSLLGTDVVGICNLTLGW